MKFFILFLFFLFSCSSPATPSLEKEAKKEGAKKEEAIEVLLTIKTGPVLPLIDTLSSYLTLPQDLLAIETMLQRDFGEAAKEIDLRNHGAEFLLGFSKDAGLFTVFSFHLASKERFSQQFQPPEITTLEKKEHAFAFRPLPGSLLSPFGTPLYLDFVEDTLLIQSVPEITKRLKLSPHNTEVSAKIAANFEALWNRFGIQFKNSYEGERKKRGMLKEKRAPDQEDVFWKALFTLSGLIKNVEISLTPQEENLLSTMKIFPQESMTIPSSPPSVISQTFLQNSLFGYQAVLPPVVLAAIANWRENFAPPALDSLGSFYPIAKEIDGKLFWSIGIEEQSFWLLASYDVRNATRARAIIRQYFTDPPNPQMVPLDPTLRFTHETEGAKKGKGPTVDTIRARWNKEESLLSFLLGVDMLESRYVFLENRVVVAVGEGGIKRLPGFLEDQNADLSSLPKPLLFEKTPTMGSAWFSQKGSATNTISLPDISLAGSLEKDFLQFEIKMLPKPLL